MCHTITKFTADETCQTSGKKEANRPVKFACPTSWTTQFYSFLFPDTSVALSPKKSIECGLTLHMSGKI